MSSIDRSIDKDRIDLLNTILTESFFNKTGDSAKAPSYDPADQYSRSDANILWDSFFKNYFPEAYKKWDVSEFDIISQQNISAKGIYKMTFDLYLQGFTKYLEDHRNTIKVDYLNAKQIAGSQVPQTTENEIKSRIWQTYLTKTDLLTRHKTIYLWVIVDLLDMISNITKTLINRSNASRIFHQALVQNVNMMAKQRFEEEEFLPIPLALIPNPDIIESNGKAQHTLAILRAYKENAQQRAEEGQSIVEGTHENYSKQNNTINKLISQLETILDGIIQKI